MNDRIDPNEWAMLKAEPAEQTRTPLIDTELEFLRDFFDAWESFQKIVSSDCHSDKKQLAAQNLVNAANCMRNYRQPVCLLQPDND